MQEGISIAFGATYCSAVREVVGGVGKKVRCGNDAAADFCMVPKVWWGTDATCIR